MIRFTGKLSFKNLENYASQNNIKLSKASNRGRYIIDDLVDNKSVEISGLKDVKITLEDILSLRSTPSDLTDIIECKDIVETLKTVKDNLSFQNAHKDTHKLLIVANNDRVMAITDNGKEYAIAVTQYDIGLEFTILLPLERAHGFCKVLEVLRKQGKLNNIAYSLNDEKLIVSFANSKFEFNILPSEIFNITDDLQETIDVFCGDNIPYETIDVFNIDKSKQSCESPDLSTEVETINNNVEKAIEDMKNIEFTSEQVQVVKTAINKVLSNTQNVPGVGNIELIPVDSLQVGMYLYYGDLLYTVNKIEKVDFINSDRSYIVTVHSLLNAVDKQQILVSDNEQLAAWSVNTKAKQSKSTDNSIKSTDKTDIKPTIDNDDNLPMPVKPATHNRGIKGNGRQMLIKMLSGGATLDQVMRSFNWSKKTASNHVTYVRQWGYNLTLENKIYQIV